MKQLTLNFQNDLEATGETMASSLPVASHNLASPSPQQEKEKAQRTLAISGRKILELFEKSNLGTSWAKTFAALLVGMGDWYSTRCALTWNLKVTKSSRYYFQLQASTHRTSGTESGLLLTPTTRQEVQDLDKFKARMKKYPNGTTMPNLATQVMGMLPTPTVGDGMRGMNANTTKLENGRFVRTSKTTGIKFGATLGMAAMTGMLPTPTARCWNTGTEKERPEDEPSRRSELNHLLAQDAGRSSQLSPQFVMEMMGLPTDWTLLPFLNGEKSQLKAQETQ